MSRYLRFIIIVALLHTFLDLSFMFDAMSDDARRRSGAVTEAVAAHPVRDAVLGVLHFPLGPRTGWFFMLPVVGQFWFVLNALVFAGGLAALHAAWTRLRRRGAGPDVTPG